MNLPANMPAPGLDGSYRDSCAVCMRGTDTGLAFTGEAEWIIAALSMLGLSQELAAEMVSQATGCEPGTVPAGEQTLYVRLCRECAASAPVPGCEVALFGPGREVPNYRQPAEGAGA